MTPRKLRTDWRVWRIGDLDGEFAIWDDGGARRAAGRWHEVGAGVIYAAQNYSTAMLEKLVHHSGEIPPNQHFIEIVIPAGTSYEVFSDAHHPGWSDRNGDVARKFGRKWYEEGRSALLVVPSVVARMERNFVFNTGHGDFGSISPGLETPVWWDDRLFAR